MTMMSIILGAMWGIEVSIWNWDLLTMLIMVLMRIRVRLLMRYLLAMALLIWNRLTMGVLVLLVIQVRLLMRHLVALTLTNLIWNFASCVGMM